MNVSSHRSVTEIFTNIFCRFVNFIPCRKRGIHGICRHLYIYTCIYTIGIKLGWSGQVLLRRLVDIWRIKRYIPIRRLGPYSSWQRMCPLLFLLQAGQCHANTCRSGHWKCRRQVDRRMFFLCWRASISRNSPGGLFKPLVWQYLLNSKSKTVSLLIRCLLNVCRCLPADRKVWANPNFPTVKVSPSQFLSH